VRHRIRTALAAALVLLTLCGPLPALEQVAAQEQTSTSGPSMEERSKAADWGLSESEWERYRRLMAGLRGSLSVPNITPIEVLGIHAESKV